MQIIPKLVIFGLLPSVNNKKSKQKKAQIWIKFLNHLFVVLLCFSRGEESKLSQAKLCGQRINENASKLYNGFRLEKCKSTLVS